MLYINLKAMYSVMWIRGSLHIPADISTWNHQAT